MKRTYWYAPEPRAIVKFQNDDRNDRYIDELVELKLAPSAHPAIESLRQSRTRHAPAA